MEEQSMTTSNTLNSQGQPNSVAINYKRNKAKAVLTLKGIIDGIHCDEHLNPTEEVFLRAWKDNDIFNLNDGDFIDIHEQIEDILEDSVITAEEKSDLQAMLDDIIQFGDTVSNDYDALVNQLLGFLNGISADDDLNDAEIRSLQDLIASNPELADTWPSNALKSRVDDTLSDGLVTDEERADLLNLIKAVSGQRMLETGLAYGMSADFSTSTETKVTLEGLNVCFTGEFLSGTRKAQQQKAEQLGATVVPRVTKKLDLLVLGSVASRDWKFSSYGKKLEAVLSNRLTGSQTEIINEDTWNELAHLV